MTMQNAWRCLSSLHAQVLTGLGDDGIGNRTLARMSSLLQATLSVFFSNPKAAWDRNAEVGIALNRMTTMHDDRPEEDDVEDEEDRWLDRMFGVD